jgi:hypothetical protein
MILDLLVFRFCIFDDLLIIQYDNLQPLVLIGDLVQLINIYVKVTFNFLNFLFHYSKAPTQGLIVNLQNLNLLSFVYVWLLSWNYSVFTHTLSVRLDLVYGLQVDFGWPIKVLLANGIHSFHELVNVLRCWA